MAQQPLQCNEGPLRNFDVKFYSLSLTLQPEQKYIQGYVDMHISTSLQQDTIQLDLDARLKTDSVWVNNSSVNFRRDSSALFVPLPTQRNHVLRVFYQGIPLESNNPPWQGGCTWTRDARGNYWAGVSIQNDGAHKWWPCKNSWCDRPDSVALQFKVPASYQAIANGKLQSVKKENAYRLFQWKISVPIALYNITFYLGKFAYVTQEWQGNRLQYYPLQYQKRAAKKHFRQCKDILQVYEQLFGKYPFYRDGFKVVEAPYWGMEHQTAIAYGNSYHNDIADYDFILLHEIAHEWWGNNVGASDPAYMWIHEAFATYSEALFMEKRYGMEVATDYLLQQQKRIKNKEIMEGTPGATLHYSDADMYYRGTWMLHTLRHHVHNDSLWFELFKKIQSQPGLYTAQSFRAAIQSFLKLNLEDFFDFFTKTTEVPMLYYRINEEGNVECRSDAPLPFTIWWKNAPLTITTSFSQVSIPQDQLRSLEQEYYLKCIATK